MWVWPNWNGAGTTLTLCLTVADVLMRWPTIKKKGATVLWLSFGLIFSGFRGGACTAGAAKSKHGSDNGVLVSVPPCCPVVVCFLSFLFLLFFFCWLIIIITVIGKISNEWMESAVKLFQEKTGTQFTSWSLCFPLGTCWTCSFLFERSTKLGTSRTRIFSILDEKPVREKKREMYSIAQ